MYREREREMCIYIYIYREREREGEICLSLTPDPRRAGKSAVSAQARVLIRTGRTPPPDRGKSQNLLTRDS